MMDTNCSGRGAWVAVCLLVVCATALTLTVLGVWMGAIR